MRLHKLFDLNGRVAVVTGGSRGLGLQIAEALGEFGAEVTLVSRKQADLDLAKKQVEAFGSAVHAVAADLSQPDEVTAFSQDMIRRFGHVDILVNNAGTVWGAPAEEHPLDAWNKVLNLNLTGMFLLSQTLARDSFLPNRKGSIINVASAKGFVADHPDMPGTAAYNAAKGAVISLTRALAAEWGGRGVRVNGIAPGYFPSRMAEANLARWEDRVIQYTPLGKLGGEDDLKGLALLLASDAGGHITGQTIIVDGGAVII